MRCGRWARHWKDLAASPTLHLAAQASGNERTHLKREIKRGTVHLLKIFKKESTKPHAASKENISSVSYWLVHLELHVVLVAEQFIRSR